MRRFALFAWVALFLPLVSTQAHAEDPKVPYEKYRLDNGLEIILHQDKSVPLVAVNVWYHVGAGDETPGKSGFAHLFEHMLFQGSKHVGEDKHFEVLRNVGATSVNGSTNLNRTNYFEIVPSHEIETALWLESDRMGYVLPLLNQKSLDNQIEVVRNEKRQRVDNVPYGTSDFKTSQALFPEGHPYRFEVIGRHEDLASSTLEDVKQFYKTWYSPANATLTVAGDFETKAAKDLIVKWFGTFPKSSKPAHTNLPMPKVKHQRLKFEEGFVELERINYVWLTPTLYSPGDAEMDILASALGAQGTGRLYRRLVIEEQLAQSVAVYQYSASLASQFVVSVTLQKGADVKAVETIMNEEIEKVRNTAIAKAEFKRAVTQFEARFVWSLENLMARVELLQGYNHYMGNPDAITKDLDRYRSSSPDRVKQFAQQYLGPKERVEIYTVPAQTKNQAKTAKGAK